MPVMNRLRESMPVILIFLIVAFVLLIVLEWGMDYLGWRTRGSEYVGKINTRTVAYQEFSELVRQAADNQKAQSNVEQDEGQMVQIRDQVWNSLVTQTLVEEQIHRLGILVTDEEIVDWVRGANPPEFLRKQFTDSTGVFNRAAYESALQNPKNRDIWITIEKSLRQQRAQEKLQSVLLASVRPTESEIFQQFVDQNVKLDVEYVLFDPNKLIKDEEVQITDADVKKYYHEHSEDFKVDATRKLKYVFFRDEPSRQDSEAVLADLHDVLRRTKQGMDFLQAAGQYGAVKASDAFFKRGELSAAKEEAVFNAKVGDVLGPLRDADGFHLIKVLEEHEGKEEFRRASHILTKIEGNDSVGALKQAREVVAAAKRGQNFGELATTYSKDQGSASRGGELGWFGKGRMVKPFEEAAFKAAVGQIVGPVKTQFGYHIIKVTGKSKKEIRIADLGIPVTTSTQTRNALSQKAEDFAYLANESGFAETAGQLGFNVAETPPFSRGATIPGFGFNETLSKFAFNGKVGDMSEVITVQFGYGVFMISEVNVVGVKALDEVKQFIQPRVLREKKMERLKLLAQEIRSALQPSDSLGQGVRVSSRQAELHVQRTGPFSISGFVPGLGRDLGFIGSASALSVGEISKPVEGSRGYFILKLLSKSPVDSTAYQAQKTTMQVQLTQEKRNRFLAEWLDLLKKNADIEDNRDMFFR